MWFFIFLFLTYLLVMSILLFSLLTIQSKAVSKLKPTKQFSIIVAFRNEETHLTGLINSFKKLQYPKDNFEIIFVNDHSSDASVEIVCQFENVFNNVQVLQLPEEFKGKKAALQMGISQAKFEYIITTDADCQVPEKWLLSYHRKLIDDQNEVLIGSVGITNTKVFLSRFQHYDVMALQAVGFSLANLGKPVLCNGANFCYRKEAFFQVNGFQGNESQPSGDDVLLLQKFVQKKFNIGFVLHCDNLVLTQAVPKLKLYIQQRKRWFYKTKYSSSLLQKGLGVFWLVINLSVLVLIALTFLKTIHLNYVLVLLLVKLCIDFLLTFEMTKKVKLPFRFFDFVLANLFYPFGIAIFIGFLTNSKIQWKERAYPT